MRQDKFPLIHIRFPGYTTLHRRSHECSAPPGHIKDCGVASPRLGRKAPPAIGGDGTASIRMAFYEAVNSVDRVLLSLSRSLSDIAIDCTHRRRPTPLPQSSLKTGDTLPRPSFNRLVSRLRRRFQKSCASLLGLAVALGFHRGAICDSPSFSIGPYLQSVTENSIIVCWESDLPSDGTVEYWIEGSPSSDSVSVDVAERHEVALTGLQPGTAYRYRVRIPKEGEGALFTASFRTAPTAGVAFNFVVYGDSRWNHAAHQTVVNAIRTVKPSFVLHTGDLVTWGDDPDSWNAFWGVVAPPEGEQSLGGNAPIFPAIGNHEYRKVLGGYGDEAIVSYCSYFVLPPNGLETEYPQWSERFYSFGYGPAFFIVLDLNYDSDPRYDATFIMGGPGPPEIHPGSPQYEWLLDQLQMAKAQYPFTFICFHPSPYSSGPWGNGAPRNARFLDPLFRQYGVDAVFSSHDHFYERCETYVEDYRILYFVEGAGGASLYSRASGWDQPGSWMWDDLNHTFYTKAFNNTAYSFINVGIVPLGNGVWQATFSAIQADGEVFDTVQIRRPWGHIAFNHDLVLSFEAIPGEIYQVDYSNDLPSSAMEWRELQAPIVANEPFVRITDDGTSTGVPPSDESVVHRFYRIRQLR
jgi:hypothetical protein